MYPNFRVIREVITSEFLRVAMYTAQGEELKRLQVAFPECYSEDVNDLCIPASLLRQMAEKRARDEGNLEEDVTVERELAWHRPLAELGVPFAFYWDPSDRIPEAVLSQLRGQPHVAGMIVEYLGERFLLAFCLTDGDYGVGKPLVLDSEVSITLIHAKFVDFDH